MAINTFDLFVYILIEHVVGFGGFAIYLWWKKSYNIPIIILRFVGEKGRPTMLMRWGKRVGTAQGSGRLKIRKYKRELRDFKAEYYFPAEKAPLGGLILWEFKRGWLTPAVPNMTDVPEEHRANCEKIMEQLSKAGIVNFNFDPDMFKKLSLKIIDDVDVEWFLREQQRIDGQYTSGWRAFLDKYGSHLTIIVIAMLLFAGYVVYLKEVPSVSAQCISGGVEAAHKTYLEDLAKKVGDTTGMASSGTAESNSGTPNVGSPPPG